MKIISNSIFNRIRTKFSTDFGSFWSNINNRMVKMGTLENVPVYLWLYFSYSETIQITFRLFWDNPDCISFYLKTNIWQFYNYFEKHFYVCKNWNKLSLISLEKLVFAYKYTRSARFKTIIIWHKAHVCWHLNGLV